MPSLCKKFPVEPEKHAFLPRNSHKIKFIFMPFPSNIKVGCSFANPAFPHLNFNTALYCHIQLAIFWDTEYFYKTKIVTRNQNDISEESTFQSHEGARTKTSCTLKFKSDAVKYAELNSNRAAAKKLALMWSKFVNGKETKLE